MKMVMAEFSGKRAGFFRPKPVYKFGDKPTCPRCGSHTHVGRTTCIVKTIPSREYIEMMTPSGLLTPETKPATIPE